MAKRNYYRTNYIKHVEKLDLRVNYPEKKLGSLGKIWGGHVPPCPNVEPPLGSALDNGDLA